MNPHFHYHLCVLDGVYEAAEEEEGKESPARSVRFHEATALTRADVEALQETVRRRVLRWFHRDGLLEEHTVREMLSWDHAGGFSLDASVRIAAHDRAGLERLLRYCARPPFALNRIEWQRSSEGAEHSVVLYRLPRPTPTAARWSGSRRSSSWTDWPPLSPRPASTDTATTEYWPPTRPSGPW